MSSEIESSLVRGDNLHGWFGLTYAQYLTIPRSVLMSMPLKWRNDLADLLNQLDAQINWQPEDGQQYRCTLHKPDLGYKDDVEITGEEFDDDRYWGKPLDDPLGPYRYNFLPTHKPHYFVFRDCYSGLINMWAAQGLPARWHSMTISNAEQMGLPWQYFDVYEDEQHGLFVYFSDMAEVFLSESYRLKLKDHHASKRFDNTVTQAKGSVEIG